MGELRETAPLTESELAEVAVALTLWGAKLFDIKQDDRAEAAIALYAKIAALNEGADK